MIQYPRYAKAMRKPSFVKTQSERGMVKALGWSVASHFQAARDDRDGSSRYRASKMPVFGRIRVVPRVFYLAPIIRGEFYFYGGKSK